jgi:hypothetical protein
MDQSDINKLGACMGPDKIGKNKFTVATKLQLLLFRPCGGSWRAREFGKVQFSN